VSRGSCGDFEGEGKTEGEMMAELAAEGKFHEVGDAEADAVFEASCHQILPNEAIGRILRNMYGRLKTAEKKLADLEASKKPKAVRPKRSVAP